MRTQKYPQLLVDGAKAKEKFTFLIKIFTEMEMPSPPLDINPAQPSTNDFKYYLLLMFSFSYSTRQQLTNQQYSNVIRYSCETKTG